MHPTMSSGGRSPKKLNSHTSSQQLKACSDNIQSCGIPVSLQGKGRKRDRVEHGSELTKGELSSKVDDGDSSKFGLDMLRAEIAKITERGGLVNVEGVDKLLDLMQLDKGGRKMDLSGRVLLADVIASTSNHDCLGRFVQLEGVLMLADWLQEAHKGKAGDSSSPKYDDRAVEELLLALLRALDKLPINIHALQTSSIGKSVNNLRTHKIPEIQKKAKSLVDTWKKRVEDEMTKICDTRTDGPNKAVAWTGKPGFTDVCQGGVKHTLSLKNAALQPSTCKSNTAKLGHLDNLAKLTSSLPAPSKSSSFGPSISITSNDIPCKTTGSSGAGDISATAMKEEKSSGSSQSQNNSQSCSSDHGKNTGTSRREDARSSASGSINASRISGNRSRHRKSRNGYQKEANNGKSTSLNKSSASAKVSQQVSERTSHFPVTDQGNSHKLIVRLPNPGRSPSRCANLGNHEGISTGGSRASSPALHDRNDQNDHKVRDGNCRSMSHSDACTRSHQGDGTKGAIGSNDGDRSSILVDEEHKSIEENGEGEVLSETVSSPSANGKGQRHTLTETNAERSHGPFSSINALIESCVKCSESTSPLSAGDELGMNLLASVAAGEIPKSDIVSPDPSPMRNSPAPEGPSIKDKSSLSSDEIVMPGPSQHNDNIIVDSNKRLGSSANVLESQSSAMQNLSGDRKSMYEIEGKLNERSTDRTNSTHASMSEKKDENHEGESTLKIRKKREVIELATNVTDNNKRGKNQPPDESKSVCTTHDESTEAGMPPHDSVRSSLICEGNIGTAESCQTHTKEAIAESKLCSSLDGNIDQPDLVNEELKVIVASEKKHTSVMDTTEDLHPFTSSNSEVTEAMNTVISSNTSQPNLSETNKEKGAILSCHSETNDDGRIEHASGNCPINNDEFPTIPVLVSTSCTGGPCGAELIQEEGSVVSKSEAECLNISSPKVDRSESDEAKKMESSTKDVSMCTPDAHVNAMKCDFDLNEGLAIDDGNQDGQADLASVQCSSSVSLSTLAPLSISSIPSCPSVPITVTAAAKGSFIPPENLLKSKAEPGWKGSAATSAFRPAEPRKVLEMPLSISEAPTDVVFVRQTRPPLEFDLNVPDERNFEDASLQNTVIETTSESGMHDISGQNVVGLDLDLNKTDEGVEVFPGCSSRRLEESLVPGRPATKASHKAEANILRREFDLNNGPAFDETGIESVPENTPIKSTATSFLPSMSNLGMNNGELGNLSSWFAPGNSYQAVAVSPFLPERGNQPYPVIAAAPSQRIMASCAGGVSFGGDFYKGAMLSSSPAMTFTSAPFPYSSFPFNSTFPVPSASFAGATTAFVDSSLSGGTCFPAVSSQIASAASSSSSAFARPYLITLPEGINSGGSGFGRSWGRQGLDLNAGPGNLESEGRDERLPSSSQALAEQTRIYHTAGNAVKRKEPEGGWDGERFTYKRPSWQ